MFGNGAEPSFVMPRLLAAGRMRISCGPVAYHPHRLVRPRSRAGCVTALLCMTADRSLGGVAEPEHAMPGLTRQKGFNKDLDLGGGADFLPA